MSNMLKVCGSMEQCDFFEDGGCLNTDKKSKCYSCFSCATREEFYKTRRLMMNLRQIHQENVAILNILTNMQQQKTK